MSESFTARSPGIVGLAIVAAAALVAGARAQERPGPDLAGLWAAERSFGPEVRGALVVHRTDGQGHLWAEIGGHRVEVEVRDRDLRFEIPGDRGYFRGAVSADGQTIAGHWVQPWAFRAFARLASPVVLSRQADGAWTGVVTPLADRLRFYLVIRRAEDGKLSAFLRNPEANIGRFYPIAEVRVESSAVRFFDSQGRERLEGRYDDDFGRLSVYFPLNGGTYDFVRADDDPGTAFYPRPPAEKPYRYRQPPAAEGWDSAPPEEVGMTAGPLQQMVRRIVDTPMDAVDAPDVHGFLVARHGKLVLEEYFHGYSRDLPHGTRSASKSITTTLVGIGVHEGVLDLDIPVYEAMIDGAPPADLDPRAGRMTLRHLITMTSGLACDDRDPSSPGGEDRMQSHEDQPDWLRYTLDLPMEHEPGEHAAYCSGGQNLAGGVLARRSGEWLPEFYRRRFAQPLDAGRYHMNLAPTGEGYGGGGLFIKPRDFLKLGQVYLNDGVWKGRRLLDAGWAAAATTTDKTIGDEGYGYGWWLFSYPFAGGEVAAYYAGGNGGQYVIVLPELDLVVAIFAGNYNQRVMHVPKYQYVRDYVLRAIEPGMLVTLED